MENENENDSKRVGIKPSKDKALITITLKKENWKKQYTLRARIGIRILQLLQVVELVLE